MKKFYSLLLAMFAIVVSGMAQTVTVNTADITDPTSWTAEGITFTAQKNDGQTAPAKNAKAGDIRLYAKNTLEVAAPAGKAIKSMVFNISAAGLKRLAPITASAGTIAAQAAGDNTVTWTGDANSVTLTVGDQADFGTDGSKKAGQLDFDVITIELGEGGGAVDPEPGVDPEPTEKTLPYTNDLMADNGDFTIVDKTKPEGLGYVWSFTSQYGAKASAYVAGTTYATESWLVSPVFDLTGLNNVTLAFEHATNKFAGTPADEAILLVNEVGTENYNAVTIPNWSENNTWDFFANSIDLSAYAGKKIQLVFKYTSTEAGAGTWEIKNFALTSTDIEEPEPEVKEYTLPYENALTADNGDFTIENKTLPEGLTRVWSFDKTYGAKASAFANSTTYAAEAWLVSPVFNLEGVTKATLGFEHATNKFAGTPADQVSLLVNEVGTENYDAITIPNWSENNTWDFFANSIDLSAYAGKKIQLVFKYTSTEAGAGTWEIKNLTFNNAAVIAPSITPNGGTFTDEVEVSIAAAGEDDVVYYTIDGTEPTPGAGTTAVYSAPFKLTESATVKAVAENAGGNLSEVAEAAFTINHSTVIPEGYTYTFLFNSEERNYTTTPENATWSDNAEGNGDLGNVTGVATEGIAIEMPEKAEGETIPTNHARLWKATGDYTLRFYNGQKLNISVPAGKNILAVVFYANKASNVSIRPADAEETLAVETGNKSVYVPATAGGTANFVATKTNQLLSIDVILDGELTGVDRVTVVNPAASDAIYDLSGRRVSNAKNGLYIVNGQKVIVK